MGAWGFASFENDDALDWVNDLSARGAEAILEAFQKVTAVVDQYHEAPESSAAVAAAEVVAAMAGKPSAYLPESVRDFLAEAGVPDTEMLKNARAATEIVLTDSELKELWAESSEHNPWMDVVTDLLARLQGSA